MFMYSNNNNNHLCITFDVTKLSPPKLMINKFSSKILSIYKMDYFFYVIFNTQSRFKLNHLIKDSLYLLLLLLFTLH